MRTVGKPDDAPVEPEESTLAHPEPGTGRGDAGERNSADVTATGRSSGSPSAPRLGSLNWWIRAAAAIAYGMRCDTSAIPSSFLQGVIANDLI